MDWSMPYCDTCDGLIPWGETVELMLSDGYKGVPTGCPICREPFRDVVGAV